MNRNNSSESRHLLGSGEATICRPGRSKETRRLRRGNGRWRGAGGGRSRPWRRSPGRTRGGAPARRSRPNQQENEPNQPQQSNRILSISRCLKGFRLGYLREDADHGGDGGAPPARREIGRVGFFSPSFRLRCVGRRAGAAVGRLRECDAHGPSWCCLLVGRAEVEWSSGRDGPAHPAMQASPMVF